MTQTGPSSPPEESGFLRRARLSRRGEPAPAEPMFTPTEFRLADTLQRAVEDRLEEGLEAIEEQATVLMREVATEIWRSSSKDVRPEQERIVTLLSRDQAIRSLIASSDERFQALAVRTARLEDHLRELSETGRTTREAMQMSARAIREIADSPSLHGVETVRNQLELVERHIAEAFAHMDERNRLLTESLDDRDRLLTDTVLTQVKDHGELIAGETSRIVESMQSYVQGGAEAVGRLAQRVEEHASMFINADHDITERIRALVAEQTTELTEQIGLVTEKVGLHGRNQEDLRSAMERTLEHRTVGLAQLIRSDSEAIRRLIEERNEQSAGATVQVLDDRMTAIEIMTQERLAALERTLQEQVLALSTATAASIERGVDRVTEAVGAIEGMGDQLAEFQTLSQDRLMLHVGERQSELEDRMRQHVDDRVTAIARLIRSDNQVLVQRFTEIAGEAEAARPAAGAGEADHELLRQVLRSVKELQAGMASDIVDTMDRRFQTVSDQLHREAQSQAETMLKIAEMLGEKVDHLSVRVDEGVGNDLQIVVDRMSDAIRAMSSSQRRQSA